MNDYLKAPVLIPSSCQEYRDQGLQINGRYNIHPNKNFPPFEVECQFEGKIGTTILDHEYSRECKIDICQVCQVTSCHAPGCGDPGPDNSQFYHTIYAKVDI